MNIDLIVRKFRKELSSIVEYGTKKNVLLAFSGGGDSVALALLLKETGVDFSLAHCNFQLRGEESEGDENFVRDFAKKHQIPLFVTLFETRKEANERNKGIQEVARELRYNWFEKIRREKDFDYVATAHHGEDRIETFFINSIRGSGVEGLKSIPFNNNGVIRPLLRFSKKELLAVIEEKGEKYRSDSSNDSLKYSRNFLRHKIIPQLDNVHPNARKGLTQTIENITEAEAYLKEKIKEDRKHLVAEEQGIIKVRKTKSPFLLYQLLKLYGFNKSQVMNLLEHTPEKGKLLYSPKFVLLVDENAYIIKPNIKIKEEVYTIESEGSYTTPFPFEITILESTDKIDFSNRHIGYFDAEKLTFPLVLRRWNKGDKFVPLGMKGQKKLSDYFTDIKANQFEKEKIWILESVGKIAWIIGNRTDDRFKLTDKTTKTIKFVTNF